MHLSQSLEFLNHETVEKTPINTWHLDDKIQQKKKKIDFNNNKKVLEIHWLFKIPFFFYK